MGRRKATPEEIQRRVAEGLREARKTRRLTQAAVARQLGLERTSVVNMELGRQGITLTSLVRWGEAVGVDVGAVLSEAIGGRHPSPADMEREALERRLGWLEHVVARIKADLVEADRWDG